MPLWGTGSNIISFTGNATNGSNVLSNIIMGTGFTNTDLRLGQVVVGVGTTGIPFETRITRIASGVTSIALSNPFIAGTATTVSFLSKAGYKPYEAKLGNKAFDGTDVFATRGGWVERRYKKIIQLTGDISSGSSIITNIVASAGSTVSDVQRGQLVGGIGIPGDPTTTMGNYVLRIAAGVTTITTSVAATRTATGVPIQLYSYYDEPVVGIRGLSSRLAEPEVQSVSFNRAQYSSGSTGTVVVSFNEAVVVLGTGSQITVTNSSTGATTATYAYGSGTNKLIYTFGVGGTGQLSIAQQTIGGAGATIVSVDRNFFNIAFTGDLTLGSKTVLNATNISQLRVGQPLVGTGISLGTTIAGIGTSSITISQQAIATGTSTALTVSEYPARPEIYASYIAGAGITGIQQARTPVYSGTNVSYFSRAAVTATVI